MLISFKLCLLGSMIQLIDNNSCILLLSSFGTSSFKVFMQKSILKMYATFSMNYIQTQTIDERKETVGFVVGFLYQLSRKDSVQLVLKIRWGNLEHFYMFRCFWSAMM